MSRTPEMSGSRGQSPLVDNLSGVGGNGRLYSHIFSRHSSEFPLDTTKMDDVTVTKMDHNSATLNYHRTVIHKGTFPQEEADFHAMVVSNGNLPEDSRRPHNMDQEREMVLNGLTPLGRG